MTNQQIIFDHRLALLEAGVLRSTGRFLRFELEDGTVEERPEPEQIHTFARWKQLGYTVRKGEKACASFDIWRHQAAGKKKDKKTGTDINIEEKMYLSKAYFFRQDQVDPTPV